MTDIAELGLSVRSDGVVVADKLLHDLERQSKKTETATERLVRQTDRMSQSMQRAGRTMSLYITAPLTAAAVASVKLAVDAEETANKFDVVFGPAAGRINARLQELTKTIPLTLTEMRAMSSGIQDMLVPMGVAREEAAGLSADMVGLAGDLASFNNVGTTRVLEAMQSALAGSSEPMRRFGVDTRETRLQTLALAEGLIKTGEELDNASRAQAVLIAIQRDSTDAMGDAARTVESTANQMRFLQRDIKDLSEEIGRDLQPIMRDLLLDTRGLVSAFAALDPETRKLTVRMAALAAVLGPLLILLGGITRALTVLTPLMISMAGLFAAIGAAVAGAAVEIERRFIPGMDAVGRTEQILNVLTRAWVILRETALGVGEAVVGIGIAVAGALRGIVSPLEAAIRSLHTALSEITSGNFKAGLAALSPTALWEEMQTAMAKAQKTIESGLGFSIEANNKRINDAVDNVVDLRNELLETGSEGASAVEEITTETENFLNLLKQISTVELPKIAASTSVEGLLPGFRSENERMIESLEEEKRALEQGGEAWEAYERTMVQAQAVAKLGDKYTAEQAERMRELAGAIFDLRNEVNLIDLERPFARFFAELSSNGDDAFRNLAESFRLSFIEQGTSELFDMIDDFTDRFADEFKELGPVIQATLVAAVEGSDRAIASAVGAAIGTALGGPAGGQIGAMLGDLIGSTFGGGTPSSNAGLLLGQRENFSGVSADRLFGSFDLFGQEAQLFARREDQQAAINASRQFLQLEESIGSTLTNIGLDLDQFSINLQGLDENAQGFGAFLGQAAEDGEAMGQGIAMQLLSVARQSIRQIAQQQEGLIPPDVLEDILFPHGAATVVGDVTDALNEYFATIGESGSLADIVAAEKDRLALIEKSVDASAEFFQELNTGFSDLGRQIRNDIDSLTGHISDSLNLTISQQILHLDDLRRQVLADHQEELRLEQQLHNTRLRLAQSLGNLAMSLRTGPLSPLPNRERFELARQDFRSMLSATLGGDMDAAQRLQGTAQTFAELSRFMFASGPGHLTAMEEILTGLDQASGMLAASEFNPQQANNRVVSQLEAINNKLELLPNKMATELSPVMLSFITQMTAAGKTSEQIANQIRSLGAPSVAAANEAAPGYVDQYATQDSVIKQAIQGVLGNSSLSMLEKAQRIHKAMDTYGISASYLAQISNLSVGQINDWFSSVGLKSFETGGPIQETGPIYAHRGEHMINADRDNLVVNVQSNTEDISNLRQVLEEIRDNERTYQEESLKADKDTERTLSDLAEAVRKAS